LLHNRVLATGGEEPSGKDGGTFGFLPNGGIAGLLPTLII